MAFVKDKTGSAQTAANASAVVVAAFADKFKDFDAAVEAFNDLREQVFADLATIVDEDNQKFKAEDGGSYAPKTSNGKTSSTSKARTSKTARGSSNKGGGKSGISLDDALNLELNFGAFEGETLQTVLNLSADDCDSEYGYGDGEREGKDYISWLSSERNKNEYVQRRARIIADAEGIDYE